MESLCDVRAMELFQGEEFVALRMWQGDSYLHADEDGRSVCHRSLSGIASHSAVWAVETRLAGAPLAQHVLLRGAYGRYLGAPDDVDARDLEGCGCCPLSFCSLVGATQRDRDGEVVDAIMWRAFACSGTEVVAGRGARGVVLLRDRSGRYLRGNKSFLACRHSVSVDGNVDSERTLQWELVSVPTFGRPELPFATEADLAELFVSACSSEVGREIRYVTADDAGNFSDQEQDWASFQYRGRSVQILREELERRVDYEVTMCVRAGRHGHLSPLLINLPRSKEILHIVLLRRTTAADEQLIFPNPNALLSEGVRMIP